MFKNYLTVAFRNLMRQKLHAFINVFGLALGIAFCLLMALFVRHEWSHDRFHVDRERIFRVVIHELQPNGHVRNFALISSPIPRALKEEFPGIDLASGFVRDSGRIASGDKTFRESVGLVSADFLSLFTFPLLAGDPATALDRPDGIVLGKAVARKLFGEPDADYGNVMGQSVTFPRKRLTFVVTGVAAPVPIASSLQFDLLIPMAHQPRFGGNNAAGGVNQSVYVRLAEGQDVREIEPAMVSFANRHMGPRVGHLRKWERIQEREDAFTLGFQPLTDVYWDDDVFSFYESQGSLAGAYILAGIAVIVLLIACSNFTTLSIAGSATRALEVGVRKVLGAGRRQVMQQFWSEALLLSFVGLLLGIALAELFLPVFNGLVERKLHISYWSDGSFLLLLLVIVAATGLIAGSYPSLMLSRFEPVTAMKGEGRIGGRSRLTRTLVVLQYTASIALMICTGVMIRQQNFVRHKHLGYDREQVLVVRTDGDKIARRYKQELLKDPRILAVTITDRAFTTGSSSTSYQFPDGARLSVRLICVDPDFLSTLKIDLLDGRNFSDEYPSDRDRAVLINETLACQLNLENPVGQPLPGFTWREIKSPTIIGVVRDFHIDSLHQPVRPLVLQMRHFQTSPSLMIRLHPGDLSNSVAMLKEAWKSVTSSGEQIRLSFLDDNLEKQYRNEERWQRMLMYASALAIAISCLGLLGLASLAVSRRTKEIGIRKVLGASVANLVSLLSRDFVKLLILANGLAWPVAYWVMDGWLADFSYRIDLGIGVFALAGALALGVALLTVGAQTVKAALANPVDALKYE
ncbi:MAG: FtsX-like permease family protein [Gemmatimonadetes bacterium]|nr:FtsX-like permease family protein [Gemmatimonadota bacterium]